MLSYLGVLVKCLSLNSFFINLNFEKLLSPEATVIGIVKAIRICSKVVTLHKQISM